MKLVAFVICELPLFLLFPPSPLFPPLLLIVLKLTVGGLFCPTSQLPNNHTKAYY